MINSILHLISDLLFRAFLLLVSRLQLTESIHHTRKHIEHYLVFGLFITMRNLTPRLTVMGLFGAGLVLVEEDVAFFSFLL